MMRGKMALEVAAEIYSRHMFSLGNVITVSIKPSSKEEQFPPICLGINGDVMGGLQAPIEVAKKRVDVGFVNPSAIVTMAYRGKGFYKQKLPLRALASFPSWDRIAFAVSKELKLESLFEIAERKLPLNVSTRSSGVGNTTRYAIDEILSLYGLSFASIKQRGGKSKSAPGRRPISGSRASKRARSMRFSTRVCTPGCQPLSIMGSRYCLWNRRFYGSSSDWDSKEPCFHRIDSRS
jgi:hypothetical protein